MPSLLMVVFVVQLLLHVVNTVGANTINELLWLLYTKLPSPTSTQARKASTAKREVVRLKRELSKVSAQDDFARWAKLQRQHDKAMAEYQKLDSSLRTHQSAFKTSISTLRWLTTQGLRMFLQFWFAREAMFWIPKGWVPRYVEWVLSFPRAPIGSVSINIWNLACACVITMAAEAVIAGYVLVTKKPVPGVTQEKEMEKPVVFEAKERMGGKKEL
ncbi:protein get1 [Sporormia fimetaria CBS 119925]|uniref:Protein get1 n=1 Tax=Sporormia fimetaria CBS 119925 TaxID=1340428 RepID=A0A6A6UXQ9_9PLEO|nr:protein get1 [Sporormia fimetaria CBS 119925]